MPAKPARIDIFKTLTEKKIVREPEPAPAPAPEPTPAPVPQEPVPTPKPKQEVQPTPEPAPPPEPKPTPESKPTPELPPEEEPANPDQEYDYLSAPQTGDSAAVRRAKVEGKERKALQKRILEIEAEREAERAEFNLQIEKLGKNAGKPALKLEEQPEFEKIRTQLEGVKKIMRLSSADPTAVETGFADMVHEYGAKVNGDSASFIAFRDDLSAKTGLEVSVLVQNLEKATDLLKTAEEFATRYKTEVEEGVVNSGYDKYVSERDVVSKAIDDFLSVVPKRDNEPVYEFLAAEIADESNSSI